jgi:hypothetical protein
MKYNLVVTTHHKTGTVWMDGVFKPLAGDLGARYVDYQAEPQMLDDLQHGPFVLFNHDSDFSEHPEVLERDDVRILHVIRDPRDVLISAMHYHKHAKENWLHVPAPRYLGTTYQRALRGKPSKFDQYVFEMENTTANTLHDMREWSYGRANCFEARYEDLRLDSDLGYWRRIMDFLGLDEEEQEMAARRFWENSLFGDLPRFGNRHIRSGEVAQWRREFNVRLGYAFLERFPGLLQQLDYEPDPRWILDLPRTDSAGMMPQLGMIVGASWALITQLTRSAGGF